jgi:hypothetical protein
MFDATGNGQWARPKLRLPSEKIMPEQGVIKDYEIDHESLDIGRSKHVMRYVSKDDFGVPEPAFLLCRFCLTDAWWKLHHRNDAIEIFNDLLQYCNHYGLLAEAIHLKISEVGENLRQIFPMAGLIPTAMRSRSWEVRYWHD